VSAPGGNGPSLPLILARELAANLATPMFIIDAAGMLVYFNDAAEVMLGKSFSEVGQITAEEFATMLAVSALDGTPMRKRDTPAGVAMFQRRPAHLTLQASTLDGRRGTYEVTAYPLFARTDEMHGVVTVFWEAPS
jgi:PAS domain-containing protein